MKYFSLKGLVVAVILFAAASVYLASVIPAGPTVEVTAEVVSRTSRSSPTGNTGMLICQLESGNTIMVEKPPHATVSVGDQVMLRSYERYIFGHKYQFGGKLITSTKTSQ